MCKSQKSAPEPEEATCHHLTLQGPVKAPIREAHFHVQHVDVDVRGVLGDGGEGGVVVVMYVGNKE